MPGRLVARTWEFQPHLDAPPRYRRACGYEAFIPDELGSLRLEIPAGVAGVVANAESRVRNLNRESSGALMPLARLLLRTESIASSKVEGLQLGVRELARAEARMEAGGKGSVKAREILANMGAMELAINEAASAAEFGEAELLAIHRRLMEGGGLGGRPGQFRTSQNWIGGNDYNPCGADYVPPPLEELPRLLGDLYGAINDELLPPLVQAALVHAQFESIHPFDDGNGRTGRALVHVVLRRRDVAPSYVPPISVILAGARDRYIAGLTRFGGDGVIEWIEQFAVTTALAAHLARRYLALVDGLLRKWRGQLSAGADPRADAAAWAIIEVLPAHPVITAPVAAAATGRSKAPVYEALAQLESAGVLVPLGTSKRWQAWEARGLLELLEVLEAAGPAILERGAEGGDT